jgi:magnesium-transporting ATPase (P-type)
MPDMDDDRPPSRTESYRNAVATGAPSSTDLQPAAHRSGNNGEQAREARQLAVPHEAGEAPGARPNRPVAKKGRKTKSKSGPPPHPPPDTADAQYDEHFQTQVALAKRFSASNIDAENPRESRGLSSAEAARLLERDGPNALSPPPKPPILYLLVKQFLNPFPILLLVAGGLSFVAYGVTGDLDVLIAAAVLVGIVFINALLSFRQELKSARVQDLFKVRKEEGGNAASVFWGARQWQCF